jgi:hypothetical protein
MDQGGVAIVLIESYRSFDVNVKVADKQFDLPK